VLSPLEGTFLTSGAVKLPPRDELGDTVPENLAGGTEGLDVDASGAGFNGSEGSGSKSNWLETPNLAAPLVLSLKICVKDGDFGGSTAGGVMGFDSSSPPIRVSGPNI
jgi:hypothetical protein